MPPAVRPARFTCGRVLVLTGCYRYRCRLQPAGTWPRAERSGPTAGWARLLGSARSVHPRLTRGRSAGPPPGTRPGRGGAVPKAVSGPAPPAPAGSVLGSRRGPSSAWLRPRFSPAFPGPAHTEGSGCSGGSLSCPLVLRPTRPAGRLSAGGSPRLDPVVSLRRVSPGDQELTGPVRPRGPYSHVIK